MLGPAITESDDQDFIYAQVESAVDRAREYEQWLDNQLGINK